MDFSRGFHFGRGFLGGPFLRSQKHMGQAMFVASHPDPVNPAAFFNSNPNGVVLASGSPEPNGKSRLPRRANFKEIYLLGCPGQEVRINGERINGLFHPLINWVYWGYNPLILTIDPNFLGHPSMKLTSC